MEKTEQTNAWKDYGNLANRLKSQLAEMKPKLNAFVVYRLLLFLAAAGIWFFYSTFQNWTIAICLGFLASFFLAVKQNNQLIARRDFLKAQLERVNSEMKVLQGEFEHQPDGSEFKDDEHQFVLDLDIFGKKSVYQYLNRAQTSTGQTRFASWLKVPLQDESKITTRQNATAELSNLTEERIAFFASSSQIEEEEDDVSNFIQWVESESTGIGSHSKALLYLVPFYSIATILAYSFDFIGLMWFLVAYFAPLFILFPKLPKVNAVYNDLGKYHRTLENYAKAFEQIERNQYSTELLREIASGAKGAHQSLNDLSKIISAFDNRNNFLLAIFLNASFLWDIRCVRKLENWRKENSANAERWFDALADFEALGSLATFHFNRKEQLTMPTFSESHLVETAGLIHPLMKFETAVPNDFDTKTFGEFSIITGANMAGKSTFLRALGVSYLLAMMGSPVVAERFSFKPVYLFTSMRTSDSLQESESYFYAELKRLQMIVNHLEAGEKLFIILDEILKGTNSTDKAEGSKKFMEKLLTFDAAGVIATHDLSLCEIEKDHPNLIVNRYFDVEIKDDDLYFDYTLRNGICSNMNATFLMRKMGITQ
ncbi:MutS-related protein [Halocola ammonii]